MSWEIDSKKKEKAQCACGQGFVIRTHVYESDDWNRYNDYVTDEKINCDECKSKYHLEKLVALINCPYKWKSDGRIEKYFLVPLGFSLNVSPTLYLPSFHTFEEEIVSRFTKEELLAAKEDMVTSKYSTKLTKGTAIEIVNVYFHRHRKRGLMQIIPLMDRCISEYEEFEWPKEKYVNLEKEIEVEREMNSKRINEVLSMSYELLFEEE